MSINNRLKSFLKDSIGSLHPKEKSAISNWTLVFVVLFLSGLQVADLYHRIPLFYLFIYLLFYVGCGLLVSLLIVWLLKLLPFIPSACKIAIVFAYLWIFYYLRNPNTYGWILIAGLIIFPILIFSGTYYWKKTPLVPLKGRKNYFWLFVLLFASAAFMLAAFIFFESGTKEKLAINYKMKGKLPAPLTLPNPAEKGPYKPVFFSYGSGTDQHRPEFGAGVKIRTSSVNADRLLPSWKGLSGKLRSQYFGFDQKTLPMNGLVWYPENKNGPLPLVMIVHGNHMAQEPSDPGYAYLGELLASKGYLVVSIDENFLNLSFTDLRIFGDRMEEENAARAWLLLKHLALFRSWNKNPSNLFYKNVDMDRIAIIGHSRGGEAVGHAAVFNKLKRYPDDAKEVFDFNFNIRSVIAIAPVDGQYKPSGTLVKVKDVNYFVFHGALDMDMQSYGGLATFKRAEFSKGFKGFKAGLYISNANHGQFNSSWGRKDGVSPEINMFNLDQLMNEHDQQSISSVFISAFLETTINLNEGYKPLFMDARYGRKWLPNMSYLSQFEPAEKIVIANFEEDVDVQTTTLPGGYISSFGLKEWKEQENNLMWGHGLSKAVYLGWDSTSVGKKTSWFSISLPAQLQKNSPIKMLSFSLAESQENIMGKEKPIDFTIELKDNHGHQISFPLSRCSYLQPQIAKNINKFRIFDEAPNSEAIPEFFYFDIATLADSNPKFQVNDIQQIRFVFDQTKSGSIVLDDIFLTDKTQSQ